MQLNLWMLFEQTSMILGLPLIVALGAWQTNSKSQIQACQTNCFQVFMNANNLWLNLNCLCVDISSEGQLKLKMCFFFWKKKLICSLVWLIALCVRIQMANGNPTKHQSSCWETQTIVPSAGTELQSPKWQDFCFLRIRKVKNGSSKHTNKAGGTDQDLQKSFGKLSRTNLTFGEVGIDHMCNQTLWEIIWMQFATKLDNKSKLRLSWSTVFTHWLYPGNFVESTRWFRFAGFTPFPQCRIDVLQVILLVISAQLFLSRKANKHSIVMQNISPKRNTLSFFLWINLDLFPKWIFSNKNSLPTTTILKMTFFFLFHFTPGIGGRSVPAYAAGHSPLT